MADRASHVTSIIKAHVLRTYNTGDSTTEPWRRLPEIPSSAEIFDKDDGDDLIQDDKHALDEMYGISSETRPDLPYNIIDRPWKDSASYIGAHYQLLREDAVYPLRKAVAEVKSTPSMKDTIDTAIYTHVHIVGITFSTQGPGIKIEFSHENAGKRIRWEHSTRLQQGTIVALTPRHDMFKNICKVAVVAARPLVDGVDLNPPRVDLFWGNWDEAEFDPAVNWVMVESRSGYWESFRHMGIALQKLRTESFPLAKYLVDLEKAIQAPNHIKRNPYTNMNSLLSNAPIAIFGDEDEDEGDPEFENVDILGTWPEIPSNLDESQLEATKRILTKQIAIVQGPPGTGKTFVSITSLKIMLQNWAPGDPPIIISAQTNHALDQLLLILAPYVPDFIRLGGRTTDKSGVIKGRTIYEVRQSQGSGQGSSASNVRHAMEKLRMSMLSNLKLLVNDEALSGQDVFDFGLITKKQFDSLHGGAFVTAAYDSNIPQTDIFNWVGIDQMCRMESKCPPINTSFQEEELDDEYENLNEDEAESGSKLNNDDEIEMLRGEFHPLKQSWTGEHASRWSLNRTLDLLKSNSDLWDIPDDYRGEIYSYFIAEAKKVIRRKFRADCKEYMRCVANSKIGKWERDAKFINRLKIKVIGCTTTGLSKYRGLLAALQPRTLLIEEAAETVEGTVLAAIFESLNQLILVGDHQQLQASNNRNELSMHPYNLAISMFERLVKNGLEHTMLNKQRRMIPEIRKTFAHVYDGLKDHDSVLDRVYNRPHVPGMGNDLWFFHHVWPESRMDTSRCNLNEAEMIANFFDYLVLNEVDPSKITVLTFYNGQRKVLQKMLRAHMNMRYLTHFNVFTVDSYQGEENDIILLSLVRSNEYQNNGFLAIQNRAVVALSRARRGLYVFGNCLGLISTRGDRCWNVWGPILEVFQESKLVSENLPLTCKNHGNITNVKQADEFGLKQLIGGCQLQCSGTLACGHKCPHNCHPFGHERLICKKPCEKILLCGHACNEICGTSCCCLPCGPLSEENSQSNLSDAGPGGWEASPGFRAKLRRTIVSTPVADRSSRNRCHGNSSASMPIPRPSSMPPYVDDPSYKPYPQYSGEYKSPWEKWNAKKSDKAFQKKREEDMVLVKNNPSIVTTCNFTDVHRPVTVNDAGRSEPKNSVKKEFAVSDPAAPLVSDKSVSVSAADMSITLGTSSGMETSLQSSGRPRVPSRPVRPPPRIDESMSTLSLVDGGMRQVHLQSQISARHLLDDDLTDCFGNSGKALQPDSMGSSMYLPAPSRQLPHQPNGSSTPQVTRTNGFKAEEGSDLLAFE